MACFVSFISVRTTHRITDVLRTRTAAKLLTAFMPSTPMHDFSSQSIETLNEGTPLSQEKY